MKAPEGYDRKVAINPECKQGKHPNCDGMAMCADLKCEAFHTCTCECHWSAGGYELARTKPSQA